MKTHFDELLDFPCHQTFKIMGIANAQMPVDVVACIQKHAPGDYAPSVKPSSKGNYQSLSVSIKVTSKEHMETLYKELSSLELVRFVL
jgi:putative lipoic acid-binding regulatory protein